MNKVAFIKVYCQVCGKEIYTASRSVLGLDNLKKEFGIFCESCTTPEEKYQLANRMLEVLIGAIK